MRTPLFESFFGHYQPQGQIEAADCVLVAEFGIGPNGSAGAVNQVLVDFALREFPEIPTFLNHRLRCFAEQSGRRLSQPVSIEGGTAHTTGRPGTIGELAAAQAYMREHQLGALALVGQAYHVSRIQRQAELVGIDPVVPAGLPDMFDPASAQWWTRNRHAWRLYEALAVPVLVRRGQL